MNILHISNPVQIPNQGYGGAEKVVYSLASWQTKCGHEVTVMAGKPSAIPNVHDASFVSGRSYNEGRFILSRLINGYSFRAICKSRNENFDIIHNHISEEGSFASIFAMSPVITTLHCPITLQRGAPLITTSLSRLLPKKTKFVSISKRSFRAYKPFYKSRLLGFVHNGINLSAIKFNPQPKSVSEITMCFLGKIIPEKYPHTAIKIADLLHSQGYNVKLFIMGKLDHPLSAYSRRLMELVKTRKYVVLKSNLNTSNVQEILGNCDVFLNTSNEIGLIMSQIEAMAAGTPVVGFVDGSAEEVVVNGFNGFLVDNLPDMARKCITAKSLNRLNCRKFVENRFSEQSMYKKYMQVYSAVISGSTN